MKKCNLILILSVMAFSFKTADAFLIPPGPFSPTLDIGGDASEVVKGVEKKLQEVQTEAQRIENEVMKKIKFAGSLVASKFSKTPLAKEKGKSNFTDTMEIKESSLANLRDEDSIVAALHDMYLVYPEDLMKREPISATSSENKSLGSVINDVKDLYESGKNLYEEGQKVASDVQNDVAETVSAAREDLAKAKDDLGIGQEQPPATASENASAENSADGKSMAEVWGESDFNDGAWELEAPAKQNKLIEKEQAEPLKKDVASPSSFKKVEFKYLEKMAFAAENANSESGLKTAFKKKAKGFADTSLLEVYQVVHSPEMQDKLNKIRQDHERLSKAYVQGQETLGGSGESASSVDDEVGNWSNAHKLNEIYDDLLAFYEELIALEAQYEAAKGIKNIEPQEPEKKQNVSAVSYKYIISVDFAQMAVEKGENATQKSSGNDKASFKPAKTITNPAFELTEDKPYEIIAPFEGAEDQFEALALADGVYNLLSEAMSMHNLKQQLPEMRKPFIEYEKMQLLHEKATEKLAESENKNAAYLANYYNDAAGVWLGNGCKFYTAQKGKKCSKIYGCTRPEEYTAVMTRRVVCPTGAVDLVEYEKRGGVSGFLTSAYKLAKADKALELTSDDFTPPVLDRNASTDIADLKNYDYDDSNGGMKSASDEDNSDEAVREQNLLRFGIGSEGAKKIGADMESENSAYGAAKMKYPLWNDEKLFYNQYITEKYKNMIAYISQVDVSSVMVDLALKMNDALEIDQATIDAYAASIPADDENRAAKIQAFIRQLEELLRSTKASDKSILNQMKQQLERKSGQTGKIGELKLKQDAELEALKQSFDKQAEDLEDEKALVLETLDEVRANLDKAREKYDAFTAQKDEAEGTENISDLVVQVSDERSQKSDTYMTNDKANAENDKAQAQKIFDQAGKKADSTLEEMETLQDREALLETKLADIEQQKKNLVVGYIQKAVALEHRQLKELKAVLAERDNEDITTGEAISSGSGSGGGSVLNYLINLSDQMALSYKQQAIDVVRNAYVQISEMGADVYNPDKYGKILQIHQNMIAGLKNARFAKKSAVFSGLLAGNASVINIVAGTAFSAIFSDNCGRLGCTSEDADYFVGLDVSARDFVAPKRMIVARTAPVRELFHFDVEDYGAMLTTPAGKHNPQTTRAEFLRYGQDIPPIWQIILSPSGFVERAVDVEEILSHSGPSSLIDAKGERPVLNEGFSELSAILKYENGLTLTDKIYDLIKYFEKVEQEEGEDVDQDELIENKHKMFTRNQFGDFLQFTDNEQEYRKAVELLKVKTDETRATIEDALLKISCPVEQNKNSQSQGADALIPSEYIADDEIYASVEKCLDEGKNMFVSEAINLMNSMPPLKEAMQERKKKLNDMLKVLQKDNEELLMLSDNTKPDGIFEEQLKTKRTDNAVRGKYDEEAMEEFEKNLDSFETPYQARYF